MGDEGVCKGLSRRNTAGRVEGEHAPDQVLHFRVRRPGLRALLALRLPPRPRHGSSRPTAARDITAPEADRC